MAQTEEKATEKAPGGPANDRGAESRALGPWRPSWPLPAIEGQIERAGRPRDISPWLVALSSPRTYEPVQSRQTSPDSRPRAAAFARAKLSTWARDDALDPQERCLAITGLTELALRSTRPRSRPYRQALATLQALTASSHFSVRACTAYSLARFEDGETLEALLLDPSPPVRSAAAIASTRIEISDTFRSRLSFVSRRDLAPAVRLAASFALDFSGSPQESPSSGPLFLTIDGRTPTNDAWICVEHENGSFLAPRLGLHPWVLLPLPVQLSSTCDGQSNPG